MKFISIITPCYNEAGNVEKTHDRIQAAMNTVPEYKYEHLYIDNCSTDGTQDILRKIASADKHVKIIFNTRNFGPNRSGAYGFYQCSGDAVICLPSDLQDPPELIPEFIKKWESGSKVVWGQKTSSKESKRMYKTRALYYKLIRGFSDVPQYEQVTGFGLYDKEVVDLLRASGEPNPNFRNMIAEYGYHVDLIQYEQQKRASGKSHYSFLMYLETAVEALVNTSFMPIKIATYFGIIASLAAFIIGAVLTVLSCVLCWGSLATATIIISSICILAGSVLLAFIGIIGQYIGEILKRVKSIPMVVENERLNFKVNDAENEEPYDK